MFVLLGILAVLIAAALPQRGQTLDVSVAGQPVDELWVLLCAALVFFMQAGFLTFEVGLARKEHATAVAMKNLIDWTVGSLAFFFVGFGLMFGSGSMFGTDFFLLDGIFEVSGTVSGPTMFSLADCAVYLAVIAHVGEEALAVTTNASMDFLRKPAADAAMLADVTLLKLGRGLAVGDVALSSEGSDALVARATLTYSRPR